MVKTVKDYCDFHFIIDARLKRQLLNKYLFKDTNSFSGIVVRILRILYPYLEKEHLGGRQRCCRYQRVAMDAAVERCSVHVYLPIDLYKRLKLMHHDLDVYSIAQLLREILRLFMGLFEEYGINLKKKLSSLLRKWHQQNTTATLTNPVIRQFLKEICYSQDEIHLLTLYNTFFIPVTFFQN